MRSATDAIDLRDIATALRHGLWWIAGGALVGLLLAGAVVLLVPPRYVGEATILLRSNTEGAAARLATSSREGGVSLGNIADMLSGDAGFKTELEILTSRDVIGTVVDSLGLQARVLAPADRPIQAVFASAYYPPELRKRRYRFEREGDHYWVRGPGAAGRAVPGVPFEAAGVVVTLRSGELPESFKVEVIGREEAIERVRKRLKASQAGGDVAELIFRAGDPLTSAAVPNGIIAQYLQRRRTVDRGVNHHRYEFLTAHTDSIAAALAAAERELRLQQERSGMLDPGLAGETELRQAMSLRSALAEREVESRALEQILAGGRLSARELAAYPTLLRNGAINHILARLLELETRRTELLDRRTEHDPDVLVVNQNIQQLEGELVTLSRAYYEGLTRQQVQLRGELRRYETSLAALPEQAEAMLRLQREVKRLSETLVALQTQLVQTRLLAMAEGGEVRQIDVAVPPQDPRFPRPTLLLLAGLIGGLFFGAAGAVGNAYVRQRIRYPWEVERALGLPATVFDARAPLLLGGTEDSRSVLVIPLGGSRGAGAVAARLAATAAVQGKSVLFADLEQPAHVEHKPADPATAVVLREAEEAPAALQPVASPDGGGYMLYRGRQNGRGFEAVRQALGDFEQRFALVVAALPGLEQSATVALLAPERAAVLVATAGQLTRPQLLEAVGLLGRMGVDTVGVVLEQGRTSWLSRN